MIFPKMRKLVVLSSLVLFLLGIPLLQGKEVKLPASDFAKAKSLLCTAERVESLKAVGKTCGRESFGGQSEDLNGDGRAEWILFGPSGECGAHGNCPVTLLKKEGEKWALLSSEPCTADGCLTWANALYSEVLNTSHNGARDLLMASDSGSFFWIKEIFEWNGKQYRRNDGATTYFLYDSEKDKLVQVTKEHWDKCSKEGKECL